MIADDLFAGAGGWDLAAAELGIYARGVENMPEARATREAAGLYTIHDDVWTFEPDGRAEGLIASPPCQSFSGAGKGKGRQALDNVLAEIDSGAYLHIEWLRSLGTEYGDERTALVLAPLHFALQGEYEWLAWEQVPPVLPVWEACATVLRSHGWHVWTGVLSAERYGVPQTRKRAKLLASRRHAVTAPRPTHSRYYSRTPEKMDVGVLPWVSMLDAIGHGLASRPSPTITGGGIETGGAEPIAKLARYRLSSDWVLRGSNQAHAAIRPITHPAPTMRGVAQSATNRHPDSERLTVAEAGVLQSFPVAFPWRGTQSKRFLQAGNAVPPRLALHSLAVAAGIAQEAVA